MCCATLEGHESTVWSLAFDPSGQRLASCSDDRTVRIWRQYLPGNEQGEGPPGSLRPVSAEGPRHMDESQKAGPFMDVPREGSSEGAGRVLGGPGEGRPFHPDGKECVNIHFNIRRDCCDFRWLRLHASSAGGTVLIPGQGTKLPHVARHSHKIKKGNSRCKEDHMSKGIESKDGLDLHQEQGSAWGRWSLGHKEFGEK